MKRLALFTMIGLCCVGFPFLSSADAMTVSQLEWTGGAVNFDGRYHQMLDRLVGQDGTLTMGQYQAMGDIVPSITKGHRTFSLFTAGFNGAPVPSATISGSSITVDLSSLFFGVSRGNSYRIWNIGGLATGLFNPDTREFCLSWDHLFDGRKHERLATFFLSRVAKVDTLPTAIPASLVLYATGLFGLGSWIWWRRRSALPTAA